MQKSGSWQGYAMVVVGLVCGLLFLGWLLCGTEGAGMTRSGQARQQGAATEEKKGLNLARMPIGTGGLIMHMPAGIEIALVVVCVRIGFVISTTVILDGG